MRGGLLKVTVAVSLALAVVALAVLLSQSTPVPAREGSIGSFGSPGIDAANTGRAEGSINSTNVADLKVAWRMPLTGVEGPYGADTSTPVVSGKVLYSQDSESNVQAIDLKSGRVLWTKRYDNVNRGPNGVVVADGRVFGATSRAAFALDQRTGRQIWWRKLVRHPTEGIDMAPGYRHGLVYLSTEPVTVKKSYGGGAIGTLWALNAKNGRKVWHFNTVPSRLWGNRAVNSGGGLWEPPSFDDSGSIYFGTGNPGPYPGTSKSPWGSSRPGRNLYTDSVVKLDARSGKLSWSYQLTPHDVYDWDLQDPPILLKVGGRRIAIGAGKAGIVIALDAGSGKLIWKQPVGIHNGHDRDSQLALRGEGDRIKTRAAVFPGRLGGVIAPMASDGSLVFVPVVNHWLKIVSPTRITENQKATGELVAIDAATGSIRWKRRLPSALFGAPLTVNDLVFATAYDGGVFAFESETGREVWHAPVPAAINAGVAIRGDTLVVPAGLANAPGQVSQLVAYRLTE